MYCLLGVKCTTSMAPMPGGFTSVEPSFSSTPAFGFLAEGCQCLSHALTNSCIMNSQIDHLRSCCKDTVSLHLSYCSTPAMFHEALVKSSLEGKTSCRLSTLSYRTRRDRCTASSSKAIRHARDGCNIGISLEPRSTPFVHMCQRKISMCASRRFVRVITRLYALRAGRLVSITRITYRMKNLEVRPLSAT